VGWALASAGSRAEGPAPSIAPSPPQLKASASPAGQPARPTPTTASPGAEEQVKRLVVMIRGKLAEAEIIGAGIIVGATPDRVYVATANHVVRQGTTAANALEVLLKWLPGEWKPATVLPDADANDDLAVVAIGDAATVASARRNLAFARRAGGVKPLDQVIAVGYPAGQAWMPRITRDPVSEVTSDTVRWEASYLERGHSGGALVNGNWDIVGLVKHDRPPVGVAIHIDRVVERLKQWGYPVTLTAAGQTTDDPRSAGGRDTSSGVTSGPISPSPRPSTALALNAADWPMYGRDASRTHWNRDEVTLKPPLRNVNRYSVRGLTIDSLSAAGGLLLAAGMSQADERNQLAALDAATGRVEWTFALAGRDAMNVAPAVAGDLVLVGGQQDDNVYALDIATGKPRFRRPGAGSSAMRHPLVVGRELHYLTTSELVALDANGKTQWTYPLRSTLSAPFSCGVLCVLGDSTGDDVATLHVVQGGQARRSFRVIASRLASPTAASFPTGPGGRPEMRAFTASGTQVAAYRLSGEQVWTLDLPGWSSRQFTPLSYANGLLIAVVSGATQSDSSVVFGVDAASGRIAWRYSTGGSGARNPVVANGVVYGSVWSTGRVFALDLKDGRELWSELVPPTSRPTADPIVAYGYLWVPAGGTIFVFGN
jgi:outer membrane protein assembly factor BamB